MMMRAANRPVVAMRQFATIGQAIIVLCCAAGLLLTFMGKEAHACDCDLPPVENGAQQADAVFVAKATEVRDLQQRQPGAYMEVTEVHAGEVHEKLFVETSNDTCAYEFEAGRDELIYATEQNGRFNAHMCSVIPVAEAAEHLAALGEGGRPLPGVQEPRQHHEPGQADETEAPDRELEDRERAEAQRDSQSTGEGTTLMMRNLALGSLILIVAVVVGRRFARRGGPG